MEHWHVAREFLIHWLHSENLHSVHSPGIFSFCSEVLYSRESNPAAEPIEMIRRKCLEDVRWVSGIDYGTGANGGTKSKKISNITRHELAPVRYARLYDRIATWLDATVILEVGTSLGITTLYLSNNPARRVTTLEGNAGIASIAEENFKESHRKNIRLMVGEASQSLSECFTIDVKIDLVLIDAGHRYASTMSFFDQSLQKIKEAGIIIIDDIHSSREMTEAWNTIVQHPKTTACIDLFRCGIVHLNQNLEKRLWRFRF